MVKTPCFHCRGKWVQSLVRELRSQVLLCGVAKKKNRKKENRKENKKERDNGDSSSKTKRSRKKKEREKLLKMLRNGRLRTSCSQNCYFKV